MLKPKEELALNKKLMKTWVCTSAMFGPKYKNESLKKCAKSD